MPDREASKELRNGDAGNGIFHYAYFGRPISALDAPLPELLRPVLSLRHVTMLVAPSVPRNSKPVMGSSIQKVPRLGWYEWT